MASKIIQRIDGILKHINTVQKEMNNISYETFKTQHLLVDAVSFNLAQIGERMNKLEEVLGDKYSNIPWKEARKMRNVIVHDYDSANYKIIYDTVINDLPILKSELNKIKNDISCVYKKSLETERLIIRPWSDFDAYELFELAKEPEIGFWCGWEPHKHIKDSLFALHNFLEVEESYAICLKSSDYLIGSISLEAHTELAKEKDECELGYWIGKPYWNSGYVTEAAKELIKHAFMDLNITKIWVGRFDGNDKSKRVQDKLGFVFHHTSKDVYCPQLKTTRVGHVSVLTKDEWLKNKGQ